jgi:hypothetical protein
MDVPANFDLADGYAFYHPAGQLSIEQGMRLVVSAIRYAREQGINRLLIDVTGITGLPHPTMLERFSLGERAASAAQSAVKVAMVAWPEMFDPHRFGVVVAQNRGLTSQVFADRTEALAWLLAVGSE